MTRQKGRSIPHARQQDTTEVDLETLLDGDDSEIAERIASDKEALFRLIEEHRIFKEAIEKSPVAYCVFDAEDRLIAFNSSYCKLHPYTKMDVDEHNRKVYYSDLVRQELKNTLSGQELEEAIEERVKRQRKASGEPEIRKYDDVGYYRITKYPLSDGAVAGLAFNIDELKQQESALQLAKEEAEEASARVQKSLDYERRRKQEGKLLSELGEWMQSCKSLAELYQVISRFMEEMFPKSSGELYIYSNSRDALDGVCSWRHGDQFTQHFQVDDCWALRRGRMYSFGSGIVNFHCEHVKNSHQKKQSDSYLCLPISAHGDTVGLLHIQCDPEAMVINNNPAIDSIEDFAVQCSEQISLAIANVRLRDELRDQSIRDSLTGLTNRRHFFERCRRAFARATHYGDTVGLICLDADNFKRLNDTWGHEAGDEVLRALGITLAESFDGDNVAARIGGEEFSILLPGYSIEETKEAAEKIRQKIEDLEVTYAGKELPTVTVSAGYSVYPDGGTTSHELMRSADTALYKAKSDGRNTIHTLYVAA